MDSRLASKMQEEKTSVWFEQNRSHWRNSQPMALVNSCKKFTNKEPFMKEESKKEDNLSGSLAEVYEKALNNVLSIQPSIKMEDSTHGQKRFEKRLTDGLDTRHFIPPEFTTFKHPFYRQSEPGFPAAKSFDGKKFNSTTKSAFHVPEKRRQSNGISRHPSWSPEHRFSYPVNYPGDYYPVVNPPAFYSRGSPYHGAYVDRMNFYPVPRGHEYPVISHVLPWTPFERDYKPCASPRYRDWCSKEKSGSPEKDPGEKSYREKASKTNGVETARIPRLTSDKTADNRRKVDAIYKPLSETVYNEKMKFDKGDNSDGVVIPSDYNVKTRRMRAFQKKSELAKENKKTAFDSPKEEFLFCLGLTRVQ